MIELGKLVVFFDYVDPVSYVLLRRLRQLEELWGGQMVHVPLEINPPSRPLLDPEEPDYTMRWEVAEPHLRELGVVHERPWIVPWTRKAHELAAHAREHNCFQEVHEALFLAYLCEGLDIGRIDVLVDLARKQGLDARETKAVLDVDRHRDEVEQAQAQSAVAGVSTPPGLLWKGQTFEGEPSLEALKRFFVSGAPHRT